MPGVKPIATIKAVGTRNFTCADDKPVSNKSTCVARFTGNGVTTDQKWDGIVYYDSEILAVFDFNTTTATGEKGKRTIVLNNIAEPPSTIPSPADPSYVSWARWTTKSDTGKPYVDYVTRVDTFNGTAPATCNGQREVVTPYTAVYEFYSCAVPGGIIAKNASSGAVSSMKIVGLTFAGVIAAMFA